jgi:hypothetical protein
MRAENGNYHYYNCCEILPINALKTWQSSSNYLGMTATNQNNIHEDIRSRFDYLKCLLQLSSEFVTVPCPI